MEKQKKTQKQWYEEKPLTRDNKIIEISNSEHIERLKVLIPVHYSKLSLNCGCGTGRQRDIFGPSIGIDLSFENIRSLVQRGGQGVVADMEFLPFKDNTFDVVYGFGILHHLNDLQKGVSEASRVLKKGGYVGFGGENNGLCILTYLLAFLYRNWKIEKGFYRIREGNLREIFRELGLRRFRMTRHGLTIFGMGEAVYKLTSLGERIFSKFKMLRFFSAYCYFAGEKS